MAILFDIEINQIKIGVRHRQDFGDLQALADSIEEIGLLQPIGITDDYQLVFGERRLRAFQLLNQEKIPAWIIDIESIVEGEYHENEIRKDFNRSERVAIGETIEKQLGERRGRPNIKEIQENFPELKGHQTRDIVAQKSGFGNGKTYQQAKKVINQGTPALIAAMDRDDLSISTAAIIADTPRIVQQEILSLPEQDQSEAISTLKALPSEERKTLSSHQAIHQSKSNEWYTPKPYLDAVHELMGGVDLDPASNDRANLIVRATRYYTIETNGFDKDWPGRVFLNPPYGKDNGESNQEAWSARLIDQYRSAITTQAVMLVNAVPDRGWFAPLFDFPICFVDHRIKFINEYGVICTQPTHANAFVYLGTNIAKFTEIFSRFGTVVARIKNTIDGQIAIDLG